MRIGKRDFITLPSCAALAPIAWPLSGGAAERLAAITPAGHAAVIHLTITDEAPLALAVVVIEALPRQP